MVKKELGIKSKKDIEKIGVEKFIETCKKFATLNEEKWLKVYKSLGGWRGYLEPYITYKNYYLESGWWTFKKLFEKGMLYQGEKPTYWCSKCETALSGYEVTDAYEDVKDPHIYVKFPLKGKENEYILVFTTTPWTLVSNVAIAVHPEEYYVRVKVGKEIFIIAEKRMEPVLKELCKLDYEILEKFLGKELEGIKYLPLLEVPTQQKLKDMQNAHKIILSIPVLKSKSYKHGVMENAKEMKGECFDFVVSDEGSGAVHTAPGHGAEDHYIGQHYKLPMVSPIDDEGKFTNDAGEFRGIFVKDADKKILERLEKRNLLLHIDWLVHSYPLCWRCKSPLIYRLTKQWFLSIDTIKDLMIKENEKVRWLPSFGKDRFRNWLEDATDWCVSRQRYWGIPLPIWICEKCGKKEVIGSEEELREKAASKLPKEIDLHKHVVDKIELKCSNCNSSMKRVPDICDVWFDSGISTWASLGYPYKNKELFESLFPSDMICESQDQIRGWFYHLMFCGVATFDRSPYTALGLMGWVLDEKGDKMSKSLGNVLWGEDALQKLGADILRLYYCWEVAPWEIQNFSFKTAEEIRRSLNILWNSYSFFTTYATENFESSLKNLRVEDKWLLSRVNSLTEEVTKHFEDFEFHHVGRKLMNFAVNDLSRFYIKLIRDRVWVSESGKDKDAALSTLHEAISTVIKLLAPIAPFISEDMYQNLTSSDKTIFRSKWLEPNKSKIDKKLEGEVEICRKIIDSCLSARQETNIKLRWPVKEFLVQSENEKVVSVVENLKDIIKSICNSKDAKIVEKKPEGEYSESDFGLGKVYVSKVLDKELLEEALIRELIREIQEMRKKNRFQVKETIALSLKSDEKTNQLLEKHSKALGKEVGAKEIVIGEFKGDFTGKVKFEGKTVEIAFDKIIGEC